MSIDVGVGGAHKDVSAMSVGVSSAWKSISGGWVGVGGVWKKFFTLVTASLSPTSLSGSRTGAGTVNTSTPNSGICVCTGVPSGGTFAWRRIADSGGNIQANTATSQSSSFSCVVGIGDSFTATFVCDYTFDGQLSTSNGVLITLSEAS